MPVDACRSAPAPVRWHVAPSPILESDGRAYGRWLVLPRTPLASVTPAVLAWGRKSIGMDLAEAARRLQVGPERLASWESGDAAPTIAQLRKMANTYKRPLAVFFLAEPPTDFDAMRDFRRLPDEDSSGWSPALHTEFRRAEYQREVSLELLEMVDEEPVRVPSASGRPDAEGLARFIRDTLDVSLDEQVAWRDQYEALAGWVSAAEAVGVLVIQTSRVPLREMRGFSIAADVLPVVALNGADAVRGRIFTLLHELAHVFVRNGGLCDLSETGPEAVTARTEVFCNEVAAAILLPRQAFSDLALRAFSGEPDDWDDATLSALANHFGASREATLRRLVTLGLASMDFYLRQRAEYLEAYEEARSESSGAPPWWRVRLRDLGRGYTRSVLDAYHRGDINSSDVADHLGIRLKHLANIESDVYRRASA